MTQVFWAFPEVTARERPRKSSRGRHHKYDHWAMLMDKLAGMTWAAIERKHGIGVVSDKPGAHACHLALCSQASKKLTPDEVRRLGNRAGP